VHLRVFKAFACEAQSVEWKIQSFQPSVDMAWLARAGLLAGWRSLSCEIASDGDATDGDRGLGRRDERDNLGRVGPVVEAVGCTGSSVTLHLSLPRKRVHWSVFILVTFNMETCNLDRKAIEDVDDTALHIAFRG
jgi:hypothetical protein